MASEEAESAAASTHATSHSIESSDASGESSGATSTEIAPPLNERDAFLLECLRNARYHEDREWFFAFIHKCAMFVVVISGTATFAFTRASPVFAAVITVAGLLDLVFDVSGKARLHASLRRRIFDVLAQAEDPSRDLAQLREQAVRVYADEPPCMHAVNAIAYNGAMTSFERPGKYHLKIEWYHRVLRHFWAFATTKFKTYEELGVRG